MRGHQFSFSLRFNFNSDVFTLIIHSSGALTINEPNHRIQLNAFVCFI